MNKNDWSTIMISFTIIKIFNIDTYVNACSHTSNSFWSHIINIPYILSNYSLQVLIKFYCKNSDDNFNLVINTYSESNLGDERNWMSNDTLWH